MFAPRRQGKTWFVTRELVPAFSEAGWETLYLDLWRRRDNPEAGLVELLEEAVPVGRIVRLLAPVKRVKVKASVAGTGGEVDVDKGTQTAASLEQRLETALAALLKNKRKRLLVLDEFQTLAGATRVGFVSSLRASLQQYQSRLFTVFTGSSRGALNAMFKSAKAPLFNSAIAITFPELGKDFINNRVNLLRERAPKLKLDSAKFFDLFEQSDHSPLFANELLLHALIHNTSDLDEIYRHWMIARSESENFDGVIARLKPLQWATLRILASWPRAGQSKPGMFSQEMRNAIQQLVPHESVTAARLQTALKRLQILQLVASEATVGDYGIEDFSLKAYLNSKHPIS